VLLDPLLPRLDSSLDSHKDAEVRQGLEPVVALAGRTGASVLGVIHVNKSGSSDPLNALMASRAFTAVARAVLFVMLDPEEETTRLLGQPKNNLGRTDLPTLAFTIAERPVDNGAVTSIRLEWRGERQQSIRETLEAAAEMSGSRTATAEAADWLSDYLFTKDGTEESAKVKAAGAKAGHSHDAIKRAFKRLKGTSSALGFPRHTIWTIPSEGECPVGVPSRSKSGESTPTAPTAPTGAGQRSESSQCNRGSPPKPAPTEDTAPSVQPADNSRVISQVTSRRARVRDRDGVSATTAPIATGRAEENRAVSGAYGEYRKDGHKILGRLKDRRTIIKVPNPERCPGCNKFTRTVDDGPRRCTTENCSGLAI
jgi:hypothetical protein